MKHTLLLMLAAFVLIAACTSNEIGYSKDVNPATVYTQYSIIKEKDQDSIRCRAQYRFAGQNGTTLVLSHPSMIQLDQQPLFVDSSDFEGAYYEKQFAPDQFSGTHYWLYTAIDGKKFKESFTLQTPVCNTAFSTTIHPASYTLSYQQLHAPVEITVALSDSAGNNYNFTRKLSSQNNQLQIEPAFFDSLAAGPITISTYINQNCALRHCPDEGGNLSLYYFIKDWQLQLERVNK
jgi:hypothetical protein